MKLYSKLGSIPPDADPLGKAATLLKLAVEECGLDGVTYSVAFDDGSFLPSIRVSTTGYIDAPFIEYGTEDDRITVERLYPVKA